MTDRAKSRLAGVVLLVLAVAGMGWVEHGARVDGVYSAKGAFIAPFALLMALDVLIHAPRMPMTSMTARDSLYAVLGVAAGVLNPNRYGAFAAESKVRMPLLLGLAAAALYLVFVLIRKRKQE